MSNSIALSVIIPVYNCEKSLETSIRSVMNQTMKDLEIILIDDGSTDNSGVLCDSIAQNDSRIVVIHKDNGGVGSARNEGMRVACGKYISFLDADDWIDSDALYFMYELCIENDLDLIRCNTIIHEDHRQRTCWVPADLCYTILDQRIVRRSIIPLMIAPENEGDYYKRLLKGCVCCIFKNELLKQNEMRFLNVKSGEDALFTMSAMWKSKRIMLIEKPFYHYMKQKSGSLSISMDRLQDYEARETARRMTLDIVDDADVVPIFLARFEQAARRYAYLDIRIATVYNPKQKAKDKIGMIKKIVNAQETVEAFSHPYQGRLPLRMSILYFLIKHKCSRILYHLVSVNGKRA